MPDELIAFAAGSDGVVVIEYPELTKVSEIGDMGSYTGSVGFTVGGLFLMVVSGGSGNWSVSGIFKTDTWEAQDTDSIDFGSPWNGPLIFGVTETSFLLNGRLIYRDPGDGVWYQDPNISMPGYIVFPVKNNDGDVVKAIFTEDTTVSSSGYGVYEYDPSDQSLTQITLPSRTGTTAWYSAIVSASRSYMTLLRREGSSGSYEWDTVVMDPSDWSVVESDDAWITEVDDGVTSIDGIPYMTPDDARIVLFYYDGTSRICRAYDFPGLTIAADNLDGIEISNDLLGGLTYAPDSSYAALVAVDSTHRGHGQIDVDALDTNSPFPFANTDEYAHKAAVANDSEHLFIADEGSGDILIFDRTLSQVGGFSASAVNNNSGVSIFDAAMLTFTLAPTGPPPKFWTDHQGTREIRRA